MGRLGGNPRQKKCINFVRHLIELEKLKGKYAISRGNVTNKTTTNINHTISETYAGEEGSRHISGRLWINGSIC